MAKRNKEIKVRVSQEEFDFIKKESARLNVSISTFIRLKVNNIL